MTIAPTESYVQNLEKYCGKVDIGDIVCDPDDNHLANKMLGMVFFGSNTNYKTPVPYFLVNKLDAYQQLSLVTDFIQKIETTTFKVVRVVTDNLSVNVKMFRKMNGDLLPPVLVHPVLPFTEKCYEPIPLVFRPL